LLLGANQSFYSSYADPRLLRFDGVSWEELDLPGDVVTSFRFEDIISYDTGEIVVLGLREDSEHDYVGVVLVHDGLDWSAHDLFPGGLARAIWGPSPDELYAVASTGEFAEYDGSNWMVWDTRFMYLAGIDGDDGVGVYITGYDQRDDRRYLLRELFD